MRNSYFKRVVCILAWPVLIGLGQFLIVAILSFIFMQKQVNMLKIEYPNETEQQIIDRVNQMDLSIPLNEYIENHMFYIIIFDIVILLFLLHEYQKYKKDVLKKHWNPILFFVPIAFSLLFHIPLIGIGVRYTVPSSVWLLLISKGIIGPIIEEYLFRGIVYHKLEAIYSKRNAMLFCTILFATFHSSIIQILFAILLGFILIFLYDKYQDIKIPIVFHIVVNMTSFLLIPYLQDFQLVWIVVLWTFSIVCFYYFLRKERFFNIIPFFRS